MAVSKNSITFAPSNNPLKPQSTMKKTLNITLSVVVETAEPMNVGSIIDNLNYSIEGNDVVEVKNHSVELQDCFEVL